MKNIKDQIKLIKFSAIVVLLSLFTVSKVNAQTSGDSSLTSPDTIVEGSRVLISGIGVSLVPPAHFVQSDDFNGFIHLGSASTLVITREEGTPFIFYKTKKVAQNFEAQGIDFLGMEEIKGDHGTKGILYTLSFTVEEITFIRLIYITGDYNAAIIVNANYPEMAKELMHDIMLESVLSVSYTKLNQ